MNRIPTLAAQEGSEAEWRRKAAFIVNLLRGAIDRSGTTADRPEGAYIGFAYFDTTINLPVWRGKGGWVKADGTAA